MFLFAGTGPDSVIILPTSQVPNNKIFFTLSIIRYLLLTVNPSSTFTEKLKVLLNKYPETDKGAMGFPRNWETELFWS